MNDVKRTTTVSLSFLVAVWSALAIAISMGLYALWQYLSVPDADARQIVLEHSWHVVVLGAIIYAMIWQVFRRILLRPIRQIFAHLYKVGTGRVERLSLESNVREVAKIVDGINVMVERMGRHLPEEPIETIRDTAKLAYDKAPGEMQIILSQVARLQEAVARTVR